MLASRTQVPSTVLQHCIPLFQCREVPPELDQASLGGGADRRADVRQDGLTESLLHRIGVDDAQGHLPVIRLHHVVHVTWLHSQNRQVQILEHPFRPAGARATPHVSPCHRLRLNTAGRSPHIVRAAKGSAGDLAQEGLGFGD